jgi:aspartate/methionine/tyrosine aminotransferase
MNVLPRGPSTAPGKALLRGQISTLPQQKIGLVSRLGLGQPDTIPLWYGESDIPTPKFICDAAHAAMLAGQTFYTHQRGIPELRAAIRDYMNRIYGTTLKDDRITATASGMAAIMLVMQAVMDAGDNAVMITPIWPNCIAAANVMGAECKRVPLQTENGVWRLDLQRVMDACDDRTRLIFVNSPGNPTGWMMEQDEQRVLLEFCRARGIWIVADEVYARIVYDRPVAPSFLQIAEPDDPLIVVNSFSKSWAMTGWRIGWLTTPPWLGDHLASLVQFSTSGVAPFIQHGALTAITEGEDFTLEMVERCRRGREAVVPRLKDIPRVTIDPPRAAFYAFFKVDGMVDSLAFAQDMFRKTKVGVAPGAAFGDEGEGWLRLCFASSADRLAIAMDRIEAHLR